MMDAENTMDNPRARLARRGWAWRRVRRRSGGECWERGADGVV